MKGKGCWEKARLILADGNQSTGALGDADATICQNDVTRSLLHIGDKGSMVCHNGKISRYAAAGEASNLSLKYRARGRADVESEKVHDNGFLSLNAALGLFNRLVDGADKEEGRFRQIVVLALKDFLEAANGFRNGNIGTGDSGKLF